MGATSEPPDSSSLRFLPRQIYYWEAWAARNATEKMRVLFLPRDHVRLKNLTSHTEYLVSISARTPRGRRPLSEPQPGCTPLQAGRRREPPAPPPPPRRCPLPTAAGHPRPRHCPCRPAGSPPANHPATPGPRRCPRAFAPPRAPLPHRSPPPHRAFHVDRRVTPGPATSAPCPRRRPHPALPPCPAAASPHPPLPPADRQSPPRPAAAPAPLLHLLPPAPAPPAPLSASPETQPRSRDFRV